MIVLDTLARRWFELAFIPVAMWALWPEGGWRRAVRFLAIASVISLVAEYASTHSPFPYGRYDYIAATHGKELYISNVPLFVPLTFGCVVVAGRALAEAIAPARRLIGIALVGAVFAMLLDVVMDPMTLRGSRWFLSTMYRYRAGGWWFGVPWSNFGGWVLVSATIIAFDGMLARGAVSPEAARRGRMLAYGTCLWFVIVAAATREWRITLGALAGTAVILLLRAVGRRRAKRFELVEAPA